jgi:hypothetical protein
MAVRMSALRAGQPLPQEDAPNIEMDIEKIRWSDMDSTDLVQDRDQWRALVNTVMNLKVP